MAIGVTPVITTGVIVITDAICTDPNLAGRCLLLIDEAPAKDHARRDARRRRARACPRVRRVLILLVVVAGKMLAYDLHSVFGFHFVEKPSAAQ